MKLIIDRKKWARGNLHGETINVHKDGVNKNLMLNQDGTMCCLGILGKAVGYTDEELLGACYPPTVAIGAEKNLFPQALVISSSDGYFRDAPADRDDTGNKRTLVDKLIGANDADECPPDEREARIIELMAQADVEVEFIG